VSKKDEVIPEKKAKAIIRAHAKVEAHRATEAGTLASAMNHANSVVKLLADVYVEADQAMQNEIRILLVALKRFRRVAHRSVQAKTGALTQATAEVDAIERLLKHAEGPGYKIVETAQVATADRVRVKQLQGSLKHRTREAAFILAELEQLVDPYPGLKIASAAQRKRNDKAREAAKAKKKVEAEPAPPTSMPSKEE
jgi:hypothetical protein